jgi:hypothetical protein
MTIRRYRYRGRHRAATIRPVPPAVDPARYSRSDLALTA